MQPMVHVNFVVIIVAATTGVNSRISLYPGLEKNLGFFKKVFKRFLFFLYEDQTRKYDPKQGGTGYGQPNLKSLGAPVTKL